MVSDTQLLMTKEILKSIADLTAAIDVEDFHFKFMSTIKLLLSPKRLAIYRINDSDSTCKIFVYLSNNNPTRLVNSRENSTEVDFYCDEIPEEIKLAKLSILKHKENYICNHNDNKQMVLPIYGLDGVIAYLSIHVDNLMTEDEETVLFNLLTISANFHSLLEENQKDKLTGLLNRKTFDDNLLKIHKIIISNKTVKNHEAIERRLGQVNPQYWLGMIDIDNFKLINDSCGHIYGDEVLVTLSKLMKKTFRPDDLLFRYGGEEFIIIIKVVDINVATKTFERFRCCIEEFNFPQISKVTISLGATQIFNTNEMATTIIGHADQALYYAKENGKNRLVIYESLVDAGVIEILALENEMELF